MLSLCSTDLARRSTFICLSCSASIRPPQGRLPLSRTGAHQRKQSSSKASNARKNEPRPPASPSNVSSDATAEEAKSAPTARSEQIRSPRASKSKGGLTTDGLKPYINLPQVPSTQGVQPLDIQLAAFFSLHRPISVSHAFPQPTTSEAFSALFDPGKTKSRAPPPKEVIQTLSQAVDSLDQALAEHEAQERGSSTSTNQPSQQDLVKTDGANLPSISDVYLPFMPPPPPQPLPERSRSRRKALQPAPKPHSPTTIKTTNTDTPLTPQDSNFPRNFFQTRPIPTLLPFRERMRGRMIRYEDRRQRGWEDEEEDGQQRRGNRGVMYAISVRRQRKLKMKKHKYKKLMKRTRNLRKKIEKGR